jgi:hypothetical protein
MTRRRLGLLIAVAVPPLVLAIFGITHPLHLTAAAAEYWRNLHIATLPVFPLLGFAPWLLVRRLTISFSTGQRRTLVWLAGILGFIYGVFYAGLDVLAGIGAGGLKLDGMGMASGIGTLYDLGRFTGTIGAVALIADVLLVGILAILRLGAGAIPGAVLVFIGSVCLYQDHIFLPWGVIGQFAIAVGWVVMVFALDRGRERVSNRESVLSADSSISYP